MNSQLAEAPKQASPIAQAMTVIANPQFPASSRANALGEMIGHYSGELMAILPPHVSLERMKQMFVLQAKQNEKLLECEPASLMKAVFTAASLGLEPDPSLGQLYLVPFGKQVQVIPGYKGLLRLVRNSGEIASISAQVVYANDKYHFNLLDPSQSYHEIRMGEERGEPIAFWAVARFIAEGAEPQIEVMTIEQVNAIRDASANHQSAKKYKKESVWDKHYDEMGRKTVLRRLIKQLPISVNRERVGQAVAIDNGTYEGRAPYIDHSTGEVVDIWGAASDAEEQAPTTQAKQSKLDAFAGEGGQA